MVVLLMSKNLSERLFSYKYKVQETSSIIHNSSTKKKHIIDNDIMEGNEKEGWYRILKFMQWAWQGVELLECYEILAKIAASKNKRTDECLLDSVIDFHSGNWSYEWIQRGMKHQKQGVIFAKNGENEKAKKSYYTSSQFYSIASYPHLKTDELSIQAQVMAFSSYRKSFEYNDNALLKEFKFKFQKKDITCLLHLPDDTQIHSVAIVSGGIEALQCDFLKMFEEHLAPAGIAMLTIDLPGIGFSSHVKLEQDSSNLHQALVEHIKNVPWIDHDKIALMGIRFGGNISTRLAFLEPKIVKSVVALGPPVASIFGEYENFQKLPPMFLDCIASRMQLTNSDAATLFQQCVPFSLVKQGLLFRSKIKTPLLSIGHKNDILCNYKDLQLIANSSSQGEAHIIDKNSIFESYLQSLNYSAEWLTKYLK